MVGGGGYILAMGVTMHLIIATGLVYFGIKTKKEWLSRCYLDLPGLAI